MIKQLQRSITYIDQLRAVSNVCTHKKYECLYKGGERERELILNKIDITNIYKKKMLQKLMKNDTFIKHK